MDDLLKIEDLKISYYTYAGEVQSVRGVSFSVRRVRHLPSWENQAAENL